MLLAILVPGCEDQRRHAAGRGADFGEAQSPVGDDAAPEAVAMATLDALREAQVSRAQGLGRPEAKKAYEQAMRSLRGLAAAQEIHERLKAVDVPGLPRDISEAAAVTHAIENWVSLVAHYVEGFKFGTLKVSVTGDSQAVAYVDAENPHDREVLEELRLNLHENTGTEDKDDEATAAPGEDRLRAKAISRGVLPPPAAGIEIRMIKVNEAWRVLRVTLGPARHAPAEPSADPASVPAG